MTAVLRIINNIHSHSQTADHSSMRKSHVLILILFLSISIFACNQKNLWENDYLNSVLPEVTLKSAIADTGQIDLIWEDPALSTVDHIEIEVESIAGITSVALGVQNCSIPGTFTPGTPYTITVKTADSFGTTSTGISFTIKPLAGGVNAYFIYTADDLNAVRGGNPVGSDYELWTLADTYYLMADINLTASGYANWDPIGDNATPFTGTFEGNNYTISNLTINTSASYQGLFGEISGGTVQDMSLTNVSITITGAAFVYTGSLAGYCIGTVTNVNTSGTLSNTSTSATSIGGLVGELVGNISDSIASVNVTGINRTGGLAGVVSTGSVISNSGSTGSVSGQQFIGGLVGYNEGSITGAIGAECYATGAVTGTFINTGGLIGMNNGGAITYCNHTTGLVSGVEHVGGLIGYNYSGGTITNCNSSGAVQCSSSYIGGLIGRNEGSLTGCNNSGSVTVSTGYCDFIGGLAGNNTAAINNCHTVNTADLTVTLDAMTGTANIGGLVGFTTGTITGCSAAGDVNATLENPSAAVAVSGNVGGLAGHAFSTTISGSSASGAVRASMEKNTAPADTLRVGGLVGNNNSTTINNNSYAAGTVTVNSTGYDAEENHIGGLAGQSTGPITNSYTTNTCDISATLGLTTADNFAYVGGLAGYSSTSAIMGSNSAGNVSANITTVSAGSESLYIGGLIGINSSAVTTCNSTGTVTASSSTYVNLVYIGGLIGNNSGVILDCHQSTGSVNGAASMSINSYSGGLIGYNTQTITGSDAAGNVTGGASASSSDTGGLVGNNTSTISVCYAAGIVDSSTPVGGLVGMNTGTIDRSYAIGNIHGDHYAGGLVGYTSSTSIITRSFATGDVSVDQGGGGGFVGVNSSGNIQNCYALGAVSGTIMYGQGIGGFAGIFSGGAIEECYSIGVVTNIGAASTLWGGLMGSCSVTIINCYYNLEGNLSGNTSYGTGVSPFSSMLLNIYTGFDFATVWDRNSSINDGYPYLVGNYIP